jgi:hypothetical protein
MPTKRHKRHGEERWKLLPEHIIRCQGHNPNGKRCGFEAEAGSVVCERHGAAAPQTRRRAAERVIMTADEAVEVITSFISDPTVPSAVRLKAAQDLADRAGLGAAQVHKIVPSTGDPVIAFFEGLLNDPAHIETLAPDGNYYTQDQLVAKAFQDSAKAIESDGTLAAEEYQRLYGDDDLNEDGELEDAEIVEDQPPAVSGNDTPPRVVLVGGCHRGGDPRSNQPVPVPAHRTCAA